MNMHAAYLFFHLSHCGTAPKHIRNKLKIRDITLFERRIIVLVAAIIRKIEKSCGETLLIETLYHKLVLLDSKTDIAVASGETPAVPSTRDHRTPLVAPRDYNIASMIVRRSPLDGAGHHSAAVC